MCSNTCNSACGCGTGGNIVSSIWSSSLKKQQKRPRVPKRGPGVAELEKILREQESIDITDKGNQDGFSSFISHHSSSNSCPSSSMKFHPPQPPTSSPKINVPLPSPLSTNLPINVPSAPIFDHLGSTTLPTLTSIYGFLEKSSGSGLVSPEKELFPLNLNSCKSKLNMNERIDTNRHDSANSPSRNLSNESNHVWSYSGSIQKINNQCSHSTVNQLRGTPTSSGSLSIGLHSHPEPPSNQSSYYTTCRVPEEQKMVGMKRSHSSSTLENSLIPPSNFHVIPSFSQYNNRSHQSSINDSHGASSFNSTKDCCRDAKWGSTLELSNARFNSDIAVLGHANFPPFVTPEVPPPPMHLFPVLLPKGNVLPNLVNEDKMDSRQYPESSEPNRRPFYNFLEVEDSEVTETMRGPNRGRREGGRVGIDLNLKL